MYCLNIVAGGPAGDDRPGRDGPKLPAVKIRKCRSLMEVEDE